MKPPAQFSRRRLSNRGEQPKPANLPLSARLTDKVEGMLLGLAIGDAAAVGALHKISATSQGQ